MNRRKLFNTIAAAGVSAAVSRVANGEPPATVLRPSALQRTGKPRLSTFEAVKAVSAPAVRELLPEIAEYYQHYGAHFSLSGEWTADQAASYTRYLQRSLRERETSVLTLEQSARILTRKRCGRPDPTSAMMAGAASRWKYTDPAYHVDPLIGTNLTVEQWRNVLAAAWHAWRQVSILTPKLSSDAKAANCTHASGVGRTDGFDGPSGVLAWAELPPNGVYTGWLLNRFDGSELWTTGTDDRSIRALNVATHEIGHLLGLEHSSDPSALMAPFYDPDVPAPVADDIRRIQKLYPVANLKPVGPTDPIPVPPAPEPPPVNPVPPKSPPAIPNDPRDGRPRWFPALPRLFPRRRGVC